MKTTPFRDWLSIVVCSLFISILCALPAQAIGTPFLIKDITTTAPSAGVGSLFDAGGGVLYFSANNGTSGNELFKFDGTTVSLVKDINPGPSSSNPANFVIMGGFVYFTADNGSMGYELWKTDGTPGGTTFVADLNTVGNSSSNPSQLTVMGANLYFVADDGVHGPELWKTDGTVVSLVQDINITPATGSNIQYLTAVGTKLFFWADDGINGLQLWSYNGIAGTMLTPTAGFYPASPIYDLNGNKAVFAATDWYSVTGVEPWVSDGTVGGTTRLDVTPGSNSGFHGSEFGVVGGFGYFMGGTMDQGSQNLYRTNGVTAGSFNAVRLPRNFVTIGSNLFFVGNDGQYGVWKTNGSTTALVAKPNTDSYWNFFNPPSNLTNVNGTLYFTSPDSTINPYTNYLWKTDGTTTTRLATNGMIPQSLAEIGGTLYFSSGGEFWSSDGTDAGTVKILINTGGNSGTVVSAALNIKGITYFTADDGVHGAELWKSDGTETGTVLVKDISPGSSSSQPEALTNIGGQLYFVANYSQLWTSDGTDAGTTQVMGFAYPPKYLTDVNGRLYFVVDDGTHGEELWQSDGTAVGTTLVKDINPGFYGAYPSSLVNVGGVLYFSADNGINGVELWKSDGTDIGTVMVSDINTSGTGASSSPAWLTNVDGTLFFSADDGVNGVGLWKSDGSASGTIEVYTGGNPIWLKALGGKLYGVLNTGPGYELFVSDVTSGVPSVISASGNGFTPGSNPMFTELNGYVYFSATNAGSGYELWKSEIASGSTTLVKDIRPGLVGSAISNLVSSNGALYFSADDGVSGEELWQSDGTSAGTSIVADLLTGTDGSNPSYLVSSGGYLHFFADDGIRGNEPMGLLLDTTPPVDGVLTALPGNGKVILSWTPASDFNGIATYKLAKSTSSTPSDCTSGIGLGNVTTFIDSSLLNDQPYYYRICAIDGTGNVSPGAVASATPKSSSVSFAAGALLFTNSTFGTTHTSDQVVNNSSGGPISVTSISFTGQNIADFTVIAGGTCGVMPGLLPSGSCTVRIAFTPNPDTSSIRDSLLVLTTGESGSPSTFMQVSGEAYASITATAGIGGSITPSNTSTHSAGSNPTFTITPDPGFYTQSVNIDGGASLGGISRYTFTNLAANHTLVATFAVIPDPFPLPFNETFDSGILPSGWSVIDNIGNGGWRFDDPSSRGNLTGGKGLFAIADSDNICNTMDAELWTPSLNMSTLSNALLEFKTDFRYYSGSLVETADVDISIDGGVNWANVWKKTGGDYRGPSTERVDLTSLAAGKPDVRVRFHHYNADCEWWWQVDDVKIYEPLFQPLNVAVTAGGSVSSTPSGINACTNNGGACSANLIDGGSYLLTAVPDSGYVFSSWSGDCSGTSKRFSLTLNSSKSCAATFVADGIAPAIGMDISQIYANQWNGGDIGTFSGPTHVAVSNSGNIYVSDAQNNRIQEFDSNFNYIRYWGGSGTGNGQFKQPMGIAFDSSGNLLVADANNNRIQKFSPTGTFISLWGSNGSGDGQFINPIGIAVDSSNNVYVADRGNNRIQKFDQNGSFITSWGTLGTGDGQLNQPRGVAIDKDGNILVADWNNNRIQKFSSTGQYLAQWGSGGAGDGQFSGPYGIAVDASNVVYVSDGNNNIQKFDSDGVFLGRIGSAGNGNGQFNWPRGMAVDAAYNFYVADAQNNRIQKFIPWSATSTTENGSYGQWAQINITLSFNKPVSSAGLSINLNNGAVVPTGAFSNLKTWSGTYTVGANQLIPALTIASVNGTITDKAGQSSSGISVPVGQNIADNKSIEISVSYPLNLGTTGSGSGSITANPTPGPYSSGASVQLSVIPAASSNFTGWGGDCAGNGTTNPISVTINGATNCTANFDIKTFTVSYVIDIPVLGNVSSPSQVVPYGGTTLPVTATSTDSGYIISGWSGTNGFVFTRSNPVTVTNVTSDMTLTAHLMSITPNSAANIGVGNSPRAVGVNPVTNKIYVVNYGGYDVTVLDGATYSTITTIPLASTGLGIGYQPVALAVNPVTNRIYVVNFNSNNVSVIDGDTDTVIAMIPVYASPGGIAINTETNKIYVGSYYSASNGYVNIIDGATNQALNYVLVQGSYPYHLAVNPVTNTVFAGTNDWKVAVIDGATNQLSTTVSTFGAPTSLAVNSATNKIYTVSPNTNRITVIDGNNSYATSEILLATLSTPTTIAVNPVSNKIYVTDNVSSGKVAVVNGATGLIDSTLSVDTNPYPLFVDTVTTAAYVGNSNSGSISTINAANSVSTRAVPGSGPTSIAYNTAYGSIYAANPFFNSVTMVQQNGISNIPLTVAVTPLSSNYTANPNPTLTVTATSSLLAVRNVYYKLDNSLGPWLKASGSAPNFTITTPVLMPGQHTLYTFATDSQDSTSNNPGTGSLPPVPSQNYSGSASSPLVGAIASYTFTFGPPPPNDNGALTATTGPGQVQLSWSAATPVSAPVTGYKVAWGINGFGMLTDCSTGINIGNVTSYTHSGLTAGQTYYYRVCAVDANNILSTGITASATVPYFITVTNAGDGAGTVSSTPSGITCGATCQASFSQGTSVTLTASPAPGSYFAGWSEPGCSGLTPTCTVTVTNDKSISATFTTRLASLLTAGWQLRNPLPQGNQLRGVTHNGSRVVAVGDSGTIVTAEASDLSAWSSRVISSTYTLNAIAYGNGTFVAVGDYGTVLTSSDGNAWTKTQEGSMGHMYGVAYGNGRFLAAGANGYVYISTDNGATWNTDSSIAGTNFIYNAVTYGNGQFVVAGQRFFNYCEDGIIGVFPDSGSPTGQYVYTPAALSHCYFGFKSIVFDGTSTFTAVGNDGSVFTSTAPTGTWAYNGNWNGTFDFNRSIIGFGNGTYVVGGYSSPIGFATIPGVNPWTDSTFSTDYTVSISALTHINNTFVAVGGSGTILTAPDTDLNAWTQRNSAVTRAHLAGIAHDGATSFVAVGASGAILNSSDGITWSQNTSTGLSQDLKAVVYGGGTFVAVGSAGTYAVSPDGVTWSTGAIASGNSLSGLSYGNGYFVALETISCDCSNPSIRILKSTDGATWSIAGSGYTGLNKTAFGLPNIGGTLVPTYVVVGSNKIYFSQDAQSWTLSGTSGLPILNAAAFGNGKFVAVGNAGAIYTSTDGDIWIDRSITAQALYNITFHNGTFIAVGASSSIYSSTDGITWRTETSNILTTLNSVIYGNGSFVAAGIGGTILQSNQLPTCSTLAISPSSANLANTSANGTLSVTADACYWYATSSDTSWLTITSERNGEGNGTIAYSASANTGTARSATITLGDKTFTVNQAGTGGTPVLSVSPPSPITFAGTTVGNNTSTTVTLSNSGTVPLVVISAMSISGSSDFAINTAVGTCGSSTPTIAAGSNCTFDVMFAPATLGAKTATLTILSNDPENSTITIGLTGSGVDTISPVDGPLTANPGDGRITLNWAAASDNVGVTGYKLVSSISGIPADCSGTVLYSGTAFTYTDTGLTNGTTFYYRVCATDAVGNWSGGSTASATPAAVCAVPPSGLMSFWKGESANGNIAVDQMGYNNGVFVNGAIVISGKVGNAFSLTGANYVKIPASPTIDVGQASGFTISGWINPTDVTTQQPIFEWNNGAASDAGIHLWKNVLGSELWANVLDTSLTNHHIATSATGLVSAGVYQHVALTYDKTTGNANIYLNGNLVASQNLGSFTPLTNGDLYLGNRWNYGVNFSGVMDEVQLYNRAISQSEIQGIVNAGSAGVCLSPAISTSPASSVSFTGTSVGNNASTTFTVNNAGTGTLSVSSMGITTGSANFSVNPGDGTGGTCGATPTISPGVSCTVTLTFAPVSASSLSGTLTITSNDSISPSLAITLTGTGIDISAPTDGTLTGTPGNAQVILNWTTASDNVAVTGYKLVSSTTGTPVDCSGIAIYSGASLTFTHTGLYGTVPYYYRICASDAAGNWSAGATASATPTVIVDSFQLPGHPVGNPYYITPGPDGNLWFSEWGDGINIGKITMAGSITEYSATASYDPPFGITSLGGDVWFTLYGSSRIGKSTTSGTVTYFTIPTSGSSPYRITAGPDGNLWFAEQSTNKIGKMSPSGTFTEYTIPTAGGGPAGIASGPDNNLWFTEASTNKIGKITTSGAITEYALTAGRSALNIISGPDGYLWFTEIGGNRIGKISTSGVISEFTIPTVNSQPLDIAVGPDGHLWFTERGATNKIGRITAAGAITEFSIPMSGLSGVTAGPDGNIWFTAYNSDKIMRLNLASIPPVPDTTSPSAAVSYSANGPYKAGTAVTITATFNEYMSASAVPKINLSGADTILADMTRVAPNIYTYSYIAGNGNGTVSVTFTSGTDLAGNLVTTTPTSGDVFILDNTAPSISIGAPSSILTNTGQVTYTVTYSDASFNASTLAAGDITLITTGTATGTVGVTGSGNSRTVTISSIAGNGTLGISITDSTASDLSGNFAPAAGPSATFTVDNQAPTVVISSITTNPTNTATIPVIVTFSEPVTGFTSAGIIVGNGTLNGFSGSGSIYSFTVTPTANGAVTIDIGAAAAQDGAGNQSVAATQFSIVYDNVAPDVTIVSQPSNPTSSTSASFSFSSTDGTAIFQCSLDGAAYGACTSPAAYAGLTAGSHSFTVRSVDPAGNNSVAPAAFSWTIDTNPPPVSITSNPANPTNSTTASFSFSSSDGTASFQCDLDGSGYSICTSPQSYSGLVQGSHTFTVKAIDPAGNSSIAAYMWSIDTTSPDVVISSTPVSLTNQTGATFGFSSSDGTASFLCDLDGGGFGACVTGKSYIGLSAGSHTFQVQSVDPAGNISQTPAVFTWTIDITPPPVSIDSTPLSLTNATSASFAFSSIDRSATFQCRLDGAGFSACTSPMNYTGPLTAGSHTFSVQALDPAGNVTLSPAAFTWSIDLTPPDVSIIANPGAYSNKTSASFSFSSTDVAATFECSLDGAAFAVCASPQNYSGLSVGNHTFSIRSLDPAGNYSATPASQTWAIDTTPPAISIGAPSATMANSGPVTYTISYSDANFSASTLNTGNITLNTTGSANATVSVTGSGASRTVTLTAMTGDGTLGISIGAGTASDLAGNIAPASGASAVFTVDTTVPIQTGTLTAIPGDTRVDLSWSAAADANGISNYLLAVSTVAVPSSCATGSSVGSGISYTHSNLTNLQPYYYRLCAVDGAGNVSSGLTGSAVPARPHTPADGDIDGDGVVSIKDALRALQIAAGYEQPNANDLKYGDVAPLVSGTPQPNGKIDVGDVVVLLRKSVGLVTW